MVLGLGLELALFGFGLGLFERVEYEGFPKGFGTTERLHAQTRYLHSNLATINNKVKKQMRPHLLV